MIFFFSGGGICLGAKSASSLSFSHCADAGLVTCVVVDVVGFPREAPFDTAHPEESGKIRKMIDSGVEAATKEHRLPEVTRSVLPGAPKIGGWKGSGSDAGTPPASPWPSLSVSKV